ncbi:MAG TPA: hypothetical protein VLY23_09290 [Candidatus Acidoferrum sp.]|nr:hypothetical protein [Candidatus Acidoferrum sp.]
MTHTHAAGNATKNIVWGAIALAAGAAFSAIAVRNLAAQERPAVQHLETPLEVRPIPAELVSRNAKVQPLLQPSVKSWVETQARIELQRPSPDLAALEAAIRARFASAPAAAPHPAPAMGSAGKAAQMASSPTSMSPGAGIPSGADIEELAFIVLMQATNDQDQDLQQIMNEVQAQTKAKQFLRQQMQAVNTDVAASAGQKPNAPCNTPACQDLARQASEITRVTSQTKKSVRLSGSAITYGELKGIQADLQGSLDSMNEMSEMTSMRLQMAMDRRSKFIEILSNILKKMSDTESSIISNLK